MKCVFTRSSVGKPPDFRPLRSGGEFSKLADCDIYFDKRDGRRLAGLKLVGFTVWKRRKTAGCHVGPPTRALVSATGQVYGEVGILLSHADALTARHHLSCELADEIIRRWRKWAD